MRYSGVKYTCGREVGDLFRACIDGVCHTGRKIIVKQVWRGHRLNKHSGGGNYDGPNGWHEWGRYQIDIDAVPVYSYGFDVVDGSMTNICPLEEDRV